MVLMVCSLFCRMCRSTDVHLHIDVRPSFPGHHDRTDILERIQYSNKYSQSRGGVTLLRSLIAQSNEAEYHPVAPPIWEITFHTESGAAVVSLLLRSTKTVLPD